MNYSPWAVLFFGTESVGNNEWTNFKRVEEVKQNLNLESSIHGYSSVFTFRPKGSLMQISHLQVYFYFTFTDICRLNLFQQILPWNFICFLLDIARIYIAMI